MRIEHIDQILPHVEGRSDFVVAKKEGYTVIDYVYAAEDTFDHPARLECRGIKFRPDGSVLARPFHKFHNIGEKAHTQPHLIDLSKPHVIMEKLDGSMVHPAILAGQFVLMTRMGRTDVAIKAESLITPQIEEVCRWHMDAGETPIFEYTAPTNRIVIKYEKPQLHLLTIRGNTTGRYWDHDDGFVKVAHSMGVEAVPFVPSQWSDVRDFIAFARVLQGKEGFVVRLSDGQWLKMKGDDYVLKHKSKDQISLEKNTLALILTGGTDDVLPLLTEDDRSSLERYAEHVRSGLRATAEKVQTLVESGAMLDQKTFAVEHLADLPTTIRALAFQVRKGLPAEKAVTDFILKNTGSQTDVDAVRGFFNAEWSL